MNWINQYQFFILLGLLIASFAITAWQVFDLKKKVTAILGGDKETPPDFQKDLIRRLARLEAKFEEFEPRLKSVEEISKISVQKIGFLRFNPFQDTGSDQSFILALLDHEDNGVVISSLYMRDGIRIYAKKIEAGKSKHPLSEEEKKVLEETINR